MCAIKDVFSNRIVGYSMDSRMKAYLAVNAVEMAVMHRGHPRGVKVHSDRGSQFRSRKFTQALERHGLVCSMGRVGAAGDNAAMESFFSLLQKTCWTAVGGPPAINFAWPLSDGWRGSIIASASNEVWGK